MSQANPVAEEGVTLWSTRLERLLKIAGEYSCFVEGAAKPATAIGANTAIYTAWSWRSVEVAACIVAEADVIPFGAISSYRFFDLVQGGIDFCVIGFVLNAVIDDDADAGEYGDNDDGNDDFNKGKTSVSMEMIMVHEFSVSCLCDLQKRGVVLYTTKHMQEHAHYAVGIDVGTKTVRCVIGHIGQGVPKIVGVGEAANSGMRRGVISHLNGPATAIDVALDAAERMSGHRVTTAALSVNGSHLVSTRADGMVAVASAGGEVAIDDVVRLEGVATTGKIPVNREILEVVPYEYKLDGQGGIKDPVGMSGTRLELRANVVSGMVPHLANTHKLAEMTNIHASRLVPSVLAGAQAVLTESQMENGVTVIDIGATTTGVAVFEEGDLQYLSVIPMGSQQVTNDLAIGLKIDLEIAEKVKLAHATLGEAPESLQGMAELKHQGNVLAFRKDEIAEIVEARYEEILELVSKELKRAGGISKMPSGAVLLGGGAQAKGIAAFAKERIGLAVRIGGIDVAGLQDQMKGPEYAAAVGLMMADATRETEGQRDMTAQKSTQVAKKATGFLKRIFAKFK